MIGLLLRLRNYICVRMLGVGWGSRLGWLRMMHGLLRVVWKALVVWFLGALI